ncbi:hypothetical protein PR003_g25654 [Phytophthora rubi]|uniref:Integrase catalytic domain-containing protein n=1 Tax=Phytophthora rubi TaxID=129364 RepID=A0A6A4CEA5_9STRA|nr:hypothetical protein PR003_g25654 [Phytophthora rubi]
MKQEVAGVIDHMQWINSGHDDSSSEENEEMIGMVQKNELQNNPNTWMLDSGSNEQVEVDAVMMMTVNADANPLMRWHERLGHLNVAAIKHMVETGKVSGMAIPKELFKKKFTCLSCMSAKAKRKSYKQSAAEKRTKVNYERLTSDTCDMGKYLPGLAGLRYFQLIQDEGSRYKWCFPLKKKSGANANTIRLMTELLAQGQRIKTITTDGGGEFMNTELKLFCASRGIRLVPTHPYTPKENALVEKLNGVLVGKMRAAMHAANLPDRLWPEVLPYIVDVDNMSSTRALNGKTPSEKLLGKVPDVKKIRMCGSVGFIHVAKQKRKTKLNPRAEPALLLGFGQTSPGYRLLHLRTGKIVETRDVRFREDITVGRSYINSLLMGQQANYKQIPFVPLPVEYVATESVRSSAEQTYHPAVATTQSQKTSCHRKRGRKTRGINPNRKRLDVSKPELRAAVDEGLLLDRLDDNAEQQQQPLGSKKMVSRFEDQLERHDLIPKSSKGKRVKVLTTKWVFVIKRDENGNILRYKARLVIHGFKQRFGFEYWDTYSPVVRITTMLLILLIALLLNLDARHVDVETAFLNSPLRDVTIYTEQPEGFDDGTGRVCWLQKGIYGLKQAARIWYQTLHAYLEELGFKRCAYDVGLYVKYVDGRIVIVTVYVDDMMIVGKTKDIDAVIEALRLKFTMKDLGRVRHLLSMEIHYEPGVMLCLSQTAYINELLERSI